ncbi:hypothetical protein ABFS83_12G146400 [Erythranthe nasuta]
MDWNGNYVCRVPFVSRPAVENSLSFLYNYNYDHQFPPEMKQQAAITDHEQAALMMQPNLIMEKNNNNNNNNNISMMNNYNMGHDINDPKKKRLSNEQLELLENSFQEDIKLEPEKKMKLSKELGLQPRQIAVWFQNRRARWKAKQLERLYDALQQEYDAVSRDKQKLQQEVMALRAILKENQVGKNKEVSIEISGEETVESTSLIPIINNNNNNELHDQIAECSYPLMKVDDYYNNNTTVIMPPPPYWPASSPN